MLLAVLAAVLVVASPLREYPFLVVVGVMLCGDWYAGRLAQRWFRR
jgi:hypothetical protein